LGVPFADTIVIAKNDETLDAGDNGDGREIVGDGRGPNRHCRLPVIRHRSNRQGALSTPEQKCISWPEQKYVSDAGNKAPELGAFS
jgi:hypothetical protein